MLCLLCLPQLASAGNLINIRESKLHAPWPLPVWGVGVGDWRDISTDGRNVQAMCQPWAVHGVNTICFELQSAKATTPFFAADGSIDEDTGARFRAITRNIRDVYFATIVGVFSPDRDKWLESKEAYFQAVRSLSKLPGDRQSCIFVIGDPYTLDRWPGDCPVDLSDHATILDMARLIESAERDILLAVPGPAFLPKSRCDNWPLLIADSSKALDEALKTIRSDGGVIETSVDKATIISLRQTYPANPPGARTTTLDDFLADVEKTRVGRYMMDMTAETMAEIAVNTPSALASLNWIRFSAGTTLDMWMTLVPGDEAWTIEDGVIHCSGRSGQWLRTRGRFSAFELSLEFKIEKDGNSGVFLWSPLAGRSSRFGMEFQIYGRHHDAPNKNNTTGAIYDVLAPKVDASRAPGEWNELHIIARPPRVRATINGQVVQDFNADEIPALQGRLREGVIGLQDHNDKVWFRNVQVLPLAPE